MRRRRSTRNGGSYYRKGDNNILSDRSGFKIKASDSRKEWNGLVVHKDEWEERHPQDFVRGVKEKITAEVVRPEPATDYEIMSANEVKAEDL